MINIFDFFTATRQQILIFSCEVQIIGGQKFSNDILRKLILTFSVGGQILIKMWKEILLLFLGSAITMNRWNFPRRSP